MTSEPIDESITERASGTRRERSRSMYSLIQVVVATIIGGPVGGGWLMFRTFDAAGNGSGKKLVVLATALLLAVVVFLALWVPTDFGNTIIPFVVAGLFAAWYGASLDSAFKSHREDGGSQASWWKAVGVGFAALVPTLVITIVAVQTLPILPVNHVRHGAYVVYYEGTATRSDAVSLAAFIRDTQMFDANSPWEFTVRFPRFSPEVAIVEMEYIGDPSDPMVERDLRVLAGQLDTDQFPEKDVELHVQNEYGFVDNVVRNE